MDIQQSLARILERKDLLADFFYTKFCDEYPEVRQFFVNVNMKRQAVLLTMALQLSVQYYAKSYPATAMYLNILGEKHEDWGIPHEHYPKFREALLDTLRLFHRDDWTAELAQQWHDAIDLATNKMLDGYDSEGRAMKDEGRRLKNGKYSAEWRLTKNEECRKAGESNPSFPGFLFSLLFVFSAHCNRLTSNEG